MSSDITRQEIDPVRWGVLGAARIAAGAVIPAMLTSPWCTPVAIGARDLGRATELATRFGMPQAYGSYDALLDDQTVEAVYIALPNHLHVEWTRKAVAKGKHVLCEKPIALTAAEAVLLRDAPAHLRIAEAFMVRHQPRWAALRDRLRENSFGRPLTMQAMLTFAMTQMDDFRARPEFGGGALYDLGCYATMTARYIFDGEPERAFSLALSNEYGADVTTTCVLDFGRGRHATFTVSIGMAAAQTLHVVCERGFLDVPEPYLPARTSNTALHVSSAMELDQPRMTTDTFAPVDQYESEVTAFSRAVRGEVVDLLGVEDAIANMAVIDAVFASARSGRWETFRV